MYNINCSQVLPKVENYTNKIRLEVVQILLPCKIWRQLFTAQVVLIYEFELLHGLS